MRTAFVVGWILGSMVTLFICWRALLKHYPTEGGKDG